MPKVDVTLSDIMEAIHDMAIHFEGSFETIEQRFGQVDQRFIQLDQRFDQVDLRLSALEVITRHLRKQVEHMDGRLQAVENDVRDIFFLLPASHEAG